MDYMENVLIVTGGSLDAEWALNWLKTITFDYVIAADKGVLYARQLGVKIDHILGDYDSMDKNTLSEYSNGVKIDRYPCEKDSTDTHLAIIEALKQGAAGIYILGATGTRMDHTLNNIGCMKAAMDAGVECFMVDYHNKIYLADENMGTVTIDKCKQHGDYISIVPMSESVDISIQGVKYPLSHYALRQGMSICQSNEITEQTARITIDRGTVIIFETRD